MPTAAQIFKNTPASLKTYVVGTVLGDGTNVINAAQVDIPLPFKGTISRLTMEAKEVGNITVAVSKGTVAGFPGDLADITGGAPPALAAAQLKQETAFAGWTTSVNAQDTLRLLTSGEATITQLTVTFEIVKEP